MNKKYSLRKSFDIERIFKRRQIVSNLYYTIYYCFSDIKTPKIAFSVSKKLGNAVVRNKEKRVLREIVRKNMGMINNCELLIVERKNALGMSFVNKEKEIIKLFDKINKKRSI